jgi:hypothetical protein
MSENLTGFLAKYKDGTTLEQKTFYFDEALNKECATNWHDVDKSKLSSLELFWKGSYKISVDLADNPEMLPEDWFFSCTGTADISGSNPKIIARNIGFRKNGVLLVFTVDEETGNLHSSTRKD